MASQNDALQGTSGTPSNLNRFVTDSDPRMAGAVTKGTTTVDFGAYPGKTDTSVAVTGQTSIVAGSVVQAWIRPVATADHSADEHLVEPIRVIAGNIVAGTGFTIYAFEATPVANNTKWKAPVPGNNPATAGNEGHRPYGQFTVAWQWS